MKVLSMFMGWVEKRGMLNGRIWAGSKIRVLHECVWDGAKSDECFMVGYGLELHVTNVVWSGMGGS